MQVNRWVPGPAKASIPKARCNGSREAIVAPAERLFVNRGFGCVSMASSRFFCALAC
jgi:hypothetical protein